MAIRLILFLLLCGGVAAEKKIVRPEGSAPGTSPLSPAVATRDLVYVSGMTGRDPQGRYPPGDVEAQTRLALERIAATLRAAGLGPQHIVSTTIYLSDIRFLPRFDAVYQQLFSAGFPARTVLEAPLMSPDALVEVSAIAAKDISSRQYVLPTGWPRPREPFSYAVLAGDTLFLSGIQPVDPGTGALAVPSIESHTERVLTTQEELLKAVGMSFGDLVFTRIYLADPATYSGLNEVYRRFVTAVPPARATVNASPTVPGAMLQIQSVAVKGSGRDRPSGEGHTSPIHSFSVRAGSRLFITGMTGRAPDGRFAVNDIAAQTRQALLTIEEQLTRHGMTFADVVDSVVWLRDPRDFEAMNEVYRTMVKPDPPARATVRIPPSSGQALIEIMMVADR